MYMPHGLLKLLTVISIAIAYPTPVAHAAEVTTIGRATVPKAGNPAAVKAGAEKAAKAKALSAAIDKVLGVNSSSKPEIKAVFDQIAEQIPEEAWSGTSQKAIGDSEFEYSVNFVMDEKDFRTLLSDLGVALSTATNRSFAILAIVDEFVSRPSDINAPLEELVEFSTEKTASVSDHSAGAASSDSSDAASSSEAARAARYGVSARASQSSRSSSSEKAEFQNAVDVQVADRTNYKKLVKYQPNGSPERTSVVYAALSAQLQDRDLKIVDNDMFRSKFFKDAPLTLEKMSNSEFLSKYVPFARSEAAADFLMVGTSVIFDAGKSNVTGSQVCNAIVSIKTYSTSGGEMIASETVSEVGSGINIDDCKGNLGRKVGAIIGPTIGARIQEYWKRRQMYGREFHVTLVGKDMPLTVRMQFQNLIKGTLNISNVNKRSESDAKVDTVVTYKGTDPVDQVIAAKLLESPTFSIIDAFTSGDNVFICMGPCRQFPEITGIAKVEAVPAPPATVTPVAAPASAPAKGKKGSK
jgi:hypothetical protein